MKRIPGIVLAVLLMVASGTVAFGNAINVNIVRNDNINEGAIINPALVPAGQLPATFGNGHWNNVQLSGNGADGQWYVTGNTWNTDPSYGGATMLSDGVTALTTSGGSAFKLTTTGNAAWGTFGTADWGQSGNTANDFHRIGYVMRDSTTAIMLVGANVPFSQYDVYAYTAYSDQFGHSVRSFRTPSERSDAGCLSLYHILPIQGQAC